MPNAPSPAEPTSQNHQGVGARVLRRFGGTLRSVIAGGIALTGRLRRPSAPQPGDTPTAPEASPSSPRKRAARRPRAICPPPGEPARPGRLAHWFGRNRLQPATRPPLSPSDNALFTPETHPDLSPEACAFFNTPVEDCDPDELCLAVAMLARHIADSIPPELGMDLEALFSTLCGRLGALPEQAGPDAEPAGEPDAAELDAPPAPPQPAVQAQQTEPVDAAACQITPRSASVTGFRPPPGRIRPYPQRRRSLVDCRRPRIHRGLRDRAQPPPPRRLCYAACAGPP